MRYMHNMHYNAREERACLRRHILLVLRCSKAPLARECRQWLPSGRAKTRVEQPIAMPRHAGLKGAKSNWGTPAMSIRPGSESSAWVQRGRLIWGLWGKKKWFSRPPEMSFGFLDVIFGGKGLEIDTYKPPNFIWSYHTHMVNTSC